MKIIKMFKNLFNPKSKKIILSLLVFGLIIATGYFFLNRSGFIETIKLAREIQKQETTDQLVLDKLKTIMLLPEDTMPTMAIINDVETLKNQQNYFFTNAKNGDRVIIYPDIAIIYDYNANKIIHVGPVQMDTNSQTQTGAETQAPISEK